MNEKIFQEFNFILKYLSKKNFEKIRIQTSIIEKVTFLTCALLANYFGI